MTERTEEKNVKEETRTYTLQPCCFNPPALQICVVSVTNPPRVHVCAACGARLPCNCVLAAPQPEPSREQSVGITIEVVGDQLVIRVGIDGLKIGAEEGPFWPKLKVLNTRKFAECIAAQIRNGEDESGATALTRALDEAIEAIVEDGEECISYDEDLIPE